MERKMRGTASQGGFTLIELVIVIFVLGALMTLAIVSLSNAQIAGRDEERRTDLSSLARKLETIYDINTSYPSTAGLSTLPTVTSTITNDGGAPPKTTGPDLYLKLTADADLNLGAFYSPGASTTSTLFSVVSPGTNGAVTLTNPAVYVYQPLASDGTLCASASTVCVSYKLYAYLEGTKALYPVVGKRQ